MKILLYEFDFALRIVSLTSAAGVAQGSVGLRIDADAKPCRSDRFVRCLDTRIFIMGIPLSDDTKALLDGANFAHLATLMPDGSPQSVPVWVGREGEFVLICTGESSLKARNTRRDPRVSLSIVDFRDPYREAQLRGRVIERRPDNDFHFMDRISHKYTGSPFPFRSPEGRVALVIEIEKAKYTKLPFQHTPPG
jgi:PPOX class probable F420-dependent enzyme